MEINNNNPFSGINYQLINSTRKNNNEKKLYNLYTEKAELENQLNAWNNIEASLKNLRFATIRLESVTRESLQSTLNALADAYNNFRDIRDSEAQGALRSSDMLSRIERQLQDTVAKLRSLDGITLEKGKLVINDAKLDKTIEDNSESIVSFLKVDGTHPSFKTTLYQALDNAMRPRLQGTLEGMIAGATFTIKNKLKHIGNNIQVTENLIAARQTITGNIRNHDKIQHEIQKMNMDIINEFFNNK